MDIDEKTKRALFDLDRLKQGWRPDAAQLKDAPVIDRWRWAGSRLAGTIIGHPRLVSTPNGLTSSVIAIDDVDGPLPAWCRTYSRWYRLGMPRDDDVIAWTPAWRQAIAEFWRFLDDVVPDDVLYGQIAIAGVSPGGEIRPTLIDDAVAIERTDVLLLQRMLMQRFQRWYPESRKIRPLPDIWDQVLSDGYPVAGHIEVGDGWGDLIISMTQMIDEIAPRDVRYSQVKEKYGSLRVYFDGPTNQSIDSIVECAENISEHVCDNCGAPGRRRDGGWIRTLCDSCDDAGGAR